MSAFVSTLPASTFVAKSSTTSVFFRPAVVPAAPARLPAGAAVRMTAAAPATAVGTPSIATKPTVIITGASSSIGLNATKFLTQDGYHVIMAVRDPAKAEREARRVGAKEENISILKVDLSTMSSVRQFVKDFKALNRPLDALVLNAAIWHPKDRAPRFTEEGLEETVATNHLGHFLMANLLLEDLRRSTIKRRSPARLIFIGTDTHNPNSIAGKIPPLANLGDLSGLSQGLGENTTGMIDNKAFESTKAYKDSKACNVLTMRAFHDKYGKTGQICVSALFPGCVAESGLFREKAGWFRNIFPAFQKNITKQYVSEEEAGRRVMAVVSDGRFTDSGSYFKWKGQTAAANPYVYSVSDEAMDIGKVEALWEQSKSIVGIP